VKLWANTIDQCRGRGKIALLIPGHQHLQIAVRVHEMNRLREIYIRTGVSVQAVFHHPVRNRGPISVAS